MFYSCYNSKSVDCNVTYLIFYFRTSKKKRKNTKKYITTDIYLIIAATNYNYNEIVIYFQYLKGLNLIKSCCVFHTHTIKKKNSSKKY